MGDRRSLADAVTDFLERLGCDRLFTVPGEAVLPVLTAAGRAGIELVPARHESGAGFAAIADSWLTGRPGVVVVNRSPGAANVGIAVDATRADPTPLVVVVGTSRRGQDRDTGYQSVDPAAQLGDGATVVTLDEPDGHERRLAHAEELLLAPVPATVLLVVPQDAWEDEPSRRPDDAGPAASIPGDHAAAEAAGRVREALGRARCPALVAGRLLRRPIDRRTVSPLLDRVARRAGLPVLLANKQQDLLDNTLDTYAGDLHQGTHPDTHARLREADLVLFVGDVPGEVHVKGWYDGQPIVTVHPEPAGPGDHLAADPAAVLTALADASWPEPTAERREWLRGWRELETRLSRGVAPPREDGVDFTLVACELDERLPSDALICLDAGNFGSWIHRYVRFRDDRRLLSLGDGAMGFGVPASVAAVRRCPERAIVVVVGDGGLLMTGNELTAARVEGRAPVVVVADNGGYGAIRFQAARAFPGTDVGAELVNPDFVQWAQSFGFDGELVSRDEEIGPAVERALGAHDGYVLHVRASRVAAHPNFELPDEAFPAAVAPSPAAAL
jgi:acetolactate synthase I/II/III large subunit